jgi:hypothetical protein
MDDDDVREPDKVIVERLIGYEDIDIDMGMGMDTFGYMDEIESDREQINRAIQQSMQDYYEDESSIFESYNNELMKRQQNVETIIMKIKKISVYDPTMKEIFDMIDPILDSYCKQYINYYELDENTYKFIFENIRKMRINAEEIAFLKSVFICV